MTQPVARFGEPRTRRPDHIGTSTQLPPRSDTALFWKRRTVVVGTVESWTTFADRERSGNGRHGDGRWTSPVALSTPPRTRVVPLRSSTVRPQAFAERRSLTRTPAR